MITNYLAKPSSLYVGFFLLLLLLFIYKVEPQQDEKEVPLVISVYGSYYTSHRIFLNYLLLVCSLGFKGAKCLISRHRHFEAPTM